MAEVVMDFNQRVTQVEERVQEAATHMVTQHDQQLRDREVAPRTRKRVLRGSSKTPGLDRAHEARMDVHRDEQNLTNIPPPGSASESSTASSASTTSRSTMRQEYLEFKGSCTLGDRKTSGSLSC